MELTIVRPIAKLSLPTISSTTTEHQLSSDSRKGVLLIAGAPGEGKTTFAQALIEEESKTKMIIKTCRLAISSFPGMLLDTTASPTHHTMRFQILLLSPDLIGPSMMKFRNKEDFVLYRT